MKNIYSSHLIHHLSPIMDKWAIWYMRFSSKKNQALF